VERSAESTSKKETEEVKKGEFRIYAKEKSPQDYSTNNYEEKTNLVKNFRHIRNCAVSKREGEWILAANERKPAVSKAWDASLS